MQLSYFSMPIVNFIFTICILFLSFCKQSLTRFNLLLVLLLYRPIHNELIHVKVTMVMSLNMLLKTSSSPMEMFMLSEVQMMERTLWTIAYVTDPE